MESWATRQCRNVYFRYVATWVLVGAITAAIPFAMPSFTVGFLFGPQALSSTEAGALTDIRMLTTSRVRVFPTKAAETGLSEVGVTMKNGEKVKEVRRADVLALIVGHKYLIAKVPVSFPEGAQAKSIEGTLKPISDEMQQQIARDCPGLLELAHPFYLDAVSPFRAYGFGYLIGAAVVGLLLATAGVRSWRGYRVPSRHPVCRRIAEWGDPAEVSHAVDRECLTAVHRHLRGIVLTDNYLVVRRFYIFDVRRLDDLLWAYENIQRYMLAGVIPIWRHCEIVFAYDDEKRRFADRHSRIQAALKYIVERVPWAATGYAAELTVAYKKDRKGLRALIDKRREEIAGTAPPASV